MAYKEIGIYNSKKRWLMAAEFRIENECPFSEDSEEMEPQSKPLSKLDTVFAYYFLIQI